MDAETNTNVSTAANTLPEGDSKTSSAGIAEANVKIAQLVGFSCLMASFLYALIGPFGVPSFSFGQLALTGGALVVSVAIVVIVCVMVYPDNMMANNKGIFAIMLIIVIATGASAVLWLLLGEGGLVVCSPLLGVAFGLESMSWCFYYYKMHSLNGPVSYWVFAENSLLTAVLVIVLACMQATYGAIGMHVLVGLSLAFLWYAMKSPSYQQAGDGNDAEDLPREARIAVSLRSGIQEFGYTVMLGIAMGFGTAPAFAGYEPLAFGIAIFGSGVLMVAVYKKAIIRWLLEQSVRFYLAVVGVVALSLAYMFGSIAQAVVLYLGVICGFASLQLRMAYSVKICRPQQSRYRDTVLRMWLCSILGIFTGILFVDVFLASLGNSKGLAVALAIMGAIVCMIGIGHGGVNLQAEYIRDSEYLQTYEDNSSRHYNLACQDFAQRYQLTDRQAEVLRYLGQGRNAHYIQEKLGISEHTVKSHIYSIYSKAEVHSQQELMELLDSLV